jgi:hypothetical protein
MSTDLSDQIHELMERGLRPVSMADIESRAPARVNPLQKAAHRLGRPGAAGRGPMLARRGWPKLALCAAALAAIAVAVPLMLGGSPSRSSGPAFPTLPAPPTSADAPPVVVSPGRYPSSASLAKAMLTAFNASADDLDYETSVGFRAGHMSQLDQSWSWPALPSTGQVQYIRDAFSMIPRGESLATGSVKLTEDDGYTTVTPRPSPYGQYEPARLTVVCYAMTGQTGCGWNRFNTPAGTWSQHTGVMQYIDYTPNPRGADVAQQIAKGEWRIIGHTSLNRQQAIELAETPSGIFQPRPVFLWVSTTTYLPLRLDWGPDSSYQQNWYYLPPTKANLAHLRVPIPPGYPRSS